MIDDKTTSTAASPRACGRGACAPSTCGPAHLRSQSHQIVYDPKLAYIMISVIRDHRPVLHLAQPQHGHASRLLAAAPQSITAKTAPQAPSS